MFQPASCGTGQYEQNYQNIQTITSYPQTQLSDAMKVVPSIQTHKIRFSCPANQYITVNYGESDGVRVNNTAGGVMEYTHTAIIKTVAFYVQNPTYCNYPLIQFIEE